MKKFLITAVLLVTGLSAQASTARLQIIHNAADPAAEVVDIYVNGDLLLDDFAFRTATPFQSVPAGVQLDIGVAPATSGSSDDALAVIPITLEANKTYVAIANGVLDPTMFSENPDMASIGFALFAEDRIREKARWSWFTDIIAFHGASDAPTVDILRDTRWARTLFDDLSYGEFSRYRTVRPGEMVLEVTPGYDNSTVVASFKADLSGLRGGSAVVFASGFLNPAANQDGPAFGLFAALVDGTVIELPAIAPMARLQVIHNAADPAAEMVDIYVNDDLLLNDFAFRAATPFIDVPAGVTLNLGIAPPTSSSSADAIAVVPVEFEGGETYVAVANGVLDPGMFAANPDGRSIGFELFAKAGARESGKNGHYQVDFFALHGATDAPTVDVIARNVATLVDDAAYGDMTGYVNVPADEYILDVTPGADNSTIVASFEADLSGLGGGAAVVFASGFLNPAANQDGPAFGLFAALPNGTVVEFPAYVPTARLQVIHNAADPAAEMVDIYVNDDLLLNDFSFRAATPFIDVPAGVTLNLGIAPPTSMSSADAIAVVPVEFEGGETYVAVANGVLDPGMFAANPDGRNIGFELFAKSGARESGENGRYKVDFFALHGATDAPTVDVIARNVATLVDDAAYGDMTDYINVPADEYILDVTPGADNSTIVASFKADLSGLRGGSAVVFASGFLNPAANQDGPAFGLFAALPNGTVVEFPVYTPMAKLQIIHNAADPAAEIVDIYVNDDLLLNDFAFRTATPFVEVPAEVALTVAVAPPTSTSSSEALATFPVEFENKGTYVAIANGVLDPGAFADNPDGESIGFNIFARDDIATSTYSRWLVRLIAFHGASDAPGVDILAQGRSYDWPLIKDLAYGEFSGYRWLLPFEYTLLVTPENDNSTVVAAYNVDLRGFGGGAAVVFASGFLNPADNQDGAAFGLFVALPDGTVIALPSANEGAARMDESLSTLPDEYDLNQNYPNPFNPSTVISFSLPKSGNVNLTVYNLLGQQVETLIDGPMDAGLHEASWDAGAYASGVYFYRLQTNDFVSTRKMMLVK